MNKLKHNISRDYTIAPNAVFRDTELSYKAKGLWLQIISLPESWDFSIAGLATLAKENETAIKTGLDELIAHKYLKWEKIKDSRGRFTVVVTTQLPDKIPHGKISSGQNTIRQNEDNKVLKDKVNNSNKVNTDKVESEDSDIVKKMYYDYLKKYAIPVTNHNVLRTKIKELEKLRGTVWCINYLTFMTQQYEYVDAKYKPEINEALDLFRKCKSIESLMTKEQSIGMVY